MGYNDLSLVPTADSLLKTAVVKSCGVPEVTQCQVIWSACVVQASFHV